MFDVLEEFSRGGAISWLMLIMPSRRHNQQSCILTFHDFLRKNAANVSVDH